MEPEGADVTDLPDWAKDRAREWLVGSGLVYFSERESSPHVQGLAALLVEVRAGEYKCPDCGCLTIWAADQYRADVLAEVRRVVLDVQKSIWGVPSDTGSAVTLCCDEILSRLDALK